MKVIRHLFKAVLLGAGLAVFGCSTTGSAATAFVGVGNGNADSFTPAITNIFTGDSVVWQWNTTTTLITHNSTSTNSAFLWSSGTHPEPFSFTNTFPGAGTFPYQCTIHVTFGMTGAVVVASANLPPTVAITNPAPGTVFAAPANVTIRASASDDGTVTNVQFRVDANILTNDSAAPFATGTNNLAVGSHTLVAIASDNNGATGTNQVVISVVTPVSVLLSAPQPVPPAKFRFNYTANVGLNYIVQRSTNIIVPNWTTLVTNLAGSGSINFTDLNATFNPGYYRVGRLPNP